MEAGHHFIGIHQRWRGWKIALVGGVVIGVVVDIVIVVVVDVVVGVVVDIAIASGVHHLLAAKIRSEKHKRKARVEN